MRCMKLEPIVIQEAEGQCESLALGLRAIAAARAVELDYDDLCAAMGLSFAAVTTVMEASPGWWMTYGRDMFLESSAKIFGFELRDLHPPDVAVDMLSAEEFAQHWELSYRPLIQRALENGQPVLAWQGWPEYRWPFWGVITGQAGDEFIGTTLWGGGERLALSQPALQCYVVERCDPFEPPASILLKTAITHADGYMNRAPYAPERIGTDPPKIVTGPAAFDPWAAWLQSDDVSEASAPQAWNDHRQHAEFIAAGRLSAGRFLRRMQAAVDPELQPTVEEAIAACESVVGLLQESRDEDQARSLFRTYTGREQLLAKVNAAEAADRRLARCVEELASGIAAGQ